MHTEVSGGFFQPCFVLDLFKVVEAERVQGVGEAVLIEQRRCDHRVQNTAVDLEARGLEPAAVIGGVVHNLVGRRGQHVLDPRFYAPFIEISASGVGNGVVA